MRIARRTLLASATAVIAAPAALRLARADAPPVVLKLHHFMSSVSSAHDRFIVPWARKVQADSGGRIRIDIFPSMQLGGAPARLFDQARDGEVDIVWTAPALTPGRFPKIEMFDLPFVPSRRALVSSKALADFAPVHLKDEFRDVRALCFSCTDRGVMHANQPIRTVEDIKDLKIHVQTRWAGEALRLLGANPVPMPLGQLQAAINAHIVDGCLDPWHLTPALRLNDVLKMHTEFSDTSPSSTTFVLAMNSAAYERLPRDLKAVIDGNSGQVAAAMAGAMWDIEAASVADTVVRGGDSIITLLPEAVAHWRKLTEPVVEKWLKDMKEQKTDGGKLLAALHTLTQKYANEPEPQPPQPPPQPAPQQDAASSQPQQTAPQPAPQAGPTSPPKIAPVSAPTNAPLVKPVPPQPPQPPVSHVATPSSAPSSPPAPTVVAKPVPPTAPAPHVAAPAPAPAPPVASPASPAATVAPAAKPAAAPVMAAPQPPPAVASPALPKPVPKSLDIPL